MQYTLCTKMKTISIDKKLVQLLSKQNIIYDGRYQLGFKVLS